MRLGGAGVNGELRGLQSSERAARGDKFVTLMAQSGVEARNRALPTWFERLKTGQIRLPRFQRFEAWSHGEVSSLAETVLRGLPAGATLLLEVGDQEPFVSRPMVGTPPPVEREVEQLLDGQQRLTALWRSLNDDYDDRTYFVFFERDEEHDGREVPRIFGQARWSKKNGQRFPLWCDEPKEVWKRRYIPLRLLRPGDVAGELSDWCDAAVENDLKASRDLERTVQKLRQSVATYNLPFLSLPAGTPKDVAVDVFIKMNTSSVRLTPFDIVVAQVEEEAGESMHDLVASLRSSVPDIEHYVEPDDLVLAVAALREDKPPTQASYQKLDLKRLVLDWDAIVLGIEWVVQVLQEERVLDGNRLPTTVVLPVLGALHEFVPPALDARGNAHGLARKYLWRAFLTRRYENSASTRSLQDFRGLRSILGDGTSDGVAPIFDESQFPLPTVEELKAAGWPKSRDILARGILAVSLRAGAQDLADGASATSENLSRREYHHLFPDHLLTEDAGLSHRESYCALNCVLITWNTNRNISAKEPIRYLTERAERSKLGEPEIRSRLSSHLVPFEPLAVGGYAEISDPVARQMGIREDYERFLTARAEQFLNPIRTLCEGRRWPEVSSA